MNTRTLLLISCLFVISAPGMQRPSRAVKKAVPGVILKEIVSEYKNPVLVTLMNVLYDERDKSFKADSFGGEPKKLAFIGPKGPVIYEPTIPMTPDLLENESRACISIDDTVEPHNFAQVWLRKVHTEEECFFEFPDIANAREEISFARDQQIQTIVKLKLNNKEELGRKTPKKNTPFVIARSVTSVCE